jgi:hypothetical protein
VLGFLGPGVAVQQLDLAPSGGAVHQEALALATPVATVPLLAPAVRQALPPFEAPGLIQALPQTPAPGILPGPSLEIQATSQHKGLILPTPTARTLTPEFPIGIKQDLAFMRGRPVLKRGIPAHRLSEDQVAYWSKRLADSKRIGPRLIKLVAVFPDLELEDGRPVAYRQDEDAIAYLLPDRPVPPSTIVMARHAHTGEPLQGRFHRE